MNRRQGLTLAFFTAAALSASALTGPAFAQDKVTLSFLVDNASNTTAWANQLKKDFEAKSPNITVDVEVRPGGTEGDNIVKTRLATGDMTDIFLYNSGSLFQAINPVQNLVPLTDQPFMNDVIDSFKTVVSANGDVYGAPIGAAMGGGVLYNIPIYEKLGLTPPKTWGEFMANSQKIKDETDKAAVIQTFKDSWTSQLFVLGDYYNVETADPGNDYAIDYMWGTTGIGYNVAKIAERMPDAPTDSWDMIFDPDVVSKFADCGVSVLDAPTEMVPAALNYLGIDVLSEDPDDLAKAEELLMKIRPYIRYFHSSQYLSLIPIFPCPRP